MTITITHTDHWVIRLADEVDLASAAELLSLAEAVALSDGAVDFDMSRVEFIDSSGWAGVHAAAGLLRAEGRAVRLTNPSPAVRRLTDALAAGRRHGRVLVTAG